MPYIYTWVFRVFYSYFLCRLLIARCTGRRVKEDEDRRGVGPRNIKAIPRCFFGSLSSFFFFFFQLGAMLRYFVFLDFFKRSACVRLCEGLFFVEFFFFLFVSFFSFDDAASGAHYARRGRRAGDARAVRDAARCRKRRRLPRPGGRIMMSRQRLKASLSAQASSS